MNNIVLHGTPACGRRTFIGTSLAFLGAGAFGALAGEEMAKHPLAGASLPKWEKGRFRISMLYNGQAETAFLVFPDGTSMLIDCGDWPCRDLPHLPDDSRRPGEWAARYVLRENPFGDKVDYFMLSHYHSDHAGDKRHAAGRSVKGNYSLSGIGHAMESLTFGKMIDRAYPDAAEMRLSSERDADARAHMLEIYAETERRGIPVERFRLEKGSGQIRLTHGGSPGFSVTPLCANGIILRRDGSLLDLGRLAGPNGSRANIGGENALSIGLVFSLGEFRYFTAGDFQGGVKRPDGRREQIEDILAKECPRVDVAKANHHGHHSMPAGLVDALRPRVVVAGMWHKAHMTRDTMRRLAKSPEPCLYAPGFLAASRRKEDAGEAWMKDVAPESFAGAHAVIDVAPDGASYRLMMVGAADEQFRILGAYDFKTSPKTVAKS